MKRVETKTISDAMRELARTIQSEDGVANTACNEAADRLDELEQEVDMLIDQLAEKIGDVNEKAKNSTERTDACWKNQCVYPGSDCSSQEKKQARSLRKAG